MKGTSLRLLPEYLFDDFHSFSIGVLTFQGALYVFLG